MRLTVFGQEQMRNASEDQMALDRSEEPHLEMAHAQLALAVLEQPFDVPATEAHQQQHLQGRCGRRVADEELDFVGVQHRPGHHQVIGPARQTLDRVQLCQGASRIQKGIRLASNTIGPLVPSLTRNRSQRTLRRRAECRSTLRT